MKTKYVVKDSEDVTLSSHREVDVALRKSEKIPNSRVVACSPFGEATVFPDEAWKWGSKVQRQPFGYRS